MCLCSDMRSLFQIPMQNYYFFTISTDTILTFANTTAPTLAFLLIHKAGDLTRVACHLTLTLLT